MNRRNLALALLAVAVGTVLRLAHADGLGLDGDALQFYEAHPYAIDLPDTYGDVPFLLPWSLGDGQAFVTLAADLDLDGPAQELARPVYRFSRVGYAWLGRLIVLGNLDLIPIGLLAINALALAGIGWITGVLVERHGPRAYVALANPAVYIAFMSDTAEALGVLLLMVTLIAPLLPAAVLAAAFLGSVRPSLITAVPARGSGLIWVLGACLSVTAAVIGIGLYSFGGDTSMPANTLALPGVGYLSLWLDDGPSLVSVLVATVALATLLVGVRRRSGAGRFAWIATAVLVLSVGEAVLGLPFNALRAAAALPVLWSLPASFGQMAGVKDPTAPAVLAATMDSADPRQPENQPRSASTFDSS